MKNNKSTLHDNVVQQTDERLERVKLFLQLQKNRVWQSTKIRRKHLKFLEFINENYETMTKFLEFTNKL